MDCLTDVCLITGSQWKLLLNLVVCLWQDCDSIRPDDCIPLSSDCSLICEFDPLIRCNADLVDKVGSIPDTMSLWPVCVQAMQAQ
jgi:hypothetical protein